MSLDIFLPSIRVGLELEVGGSELGVESWKLGVGSYCRIDRGDVLKTAGGVVAIGGGRDGARPSGGT